MYFWDYLMYIVYICVFQLFGIILCIYKMYKIINKLLLYLLENVTHLKKVVHFKKLYIII